MITLRILRWLFGYVVFTVKGGYPERFLNLTAHLGICLWNIKKKENNSLQAAVKVREYRALRPLAHKSGSKLHVIKRRGLPFYLYKFRNRKGIFVGMIIFALIVGFLSQYVWCVDISGNTTIKYDEINHAVVELGLLPGIRKKDVVPLMLEQKLMLKYPDISWLSVNTRGCTVTIQLKEKIKNLKTPETEENKKIGNMKASRSGQIIRIDVFKGEAVVKNGDAVVEGQLLISGIVESKVGSVDFVRAAGQVLASTKQTVKAEIPLKQTVTEFTGKTVVRRSANIFGLQIPLTFVGVPKGNYQREVNVTSLQAPNATLPVSVLTETWREKATKTITLTQKEAEKQAEEKVEELIKTQLKNVKILKKNKSVTVKNGVYTVALNCDCEENIAVESEILVN